MKLYEHQEKIIKEDKKKVGLFLGTGAGKTITALSLANTDRGKTLIICPKTQKEDKNWERDNKEIGADITVISKETFRRDHEKLPRFDTVIIDEAHTCLGATPNVRYVKRQPIPKTSQLFEALESYLKRTKPERLYPVTATILRSPMTVWACARLFGLAWDFYKFRDTFYFRLNMPGRDIFAVKSYKQTKDLLASLVLKLGYVGRLEDYFDVPEQTFKDVYLRLTPKQEDMISLISVEYPDPIVQIGKKHSIENGVLNGDEFSEDVIFSSEKIDWIVEHSYEFPKMIIFAKYTLQIKQIELALKAIGKKTFVMTGQVKDRGALLKEAKACDDYVFICQSQISAGWELPDCPVMVFASRTYSFVDYDQALGRILRANKLKKNLYINLIIKGGIDEALDKSLKNKQDFSEILYAKTRS